MGTALEMREMHFPDCVPIESYGDGGFRFSNFMHKGSILCMPSGIYQIETRNSIFQIRNFNKIFEQSKELDLILLGTGKKIQPLEPLILKKIKENNLVAEIMSTGSAVRTYNILLSEGRRVAALLLAVC